MTSQTGLQEAIMRSQGRHFSNDELQRILMLLRETDMTLSDIAGRMGCSRNAVAVINRKFEIRRYDGKRTRWDVKPDDARAVMEA
jgi:transposase-like protein